MKILVTGVSGFVGQSLVKALNQRDVCVIGVGRELTAPNADTYFAVPDFTDQSAWIKPLEGCDVVIHLAARVHVMKEEAVDALAEFRKVNVEGTIALAAQAAKAGVKRFIYISSIKVNGEFTELNKPFASQDIANPQDAYAISKYEAEQGLMRIAQQVDMDVVIIRPPLIYGAGVKANFASMLRAVKRGVPMPLGAIHNKRSFVYVGNLVSLIVRCIDHPAAKTQVFLVSDGHDLSTTELLQQCAAALGVKSRLLPIPQSIIKACAALLGKQTAAQRLSGNLQVDISKTCSLLDWKPPITVAEGLKMTALASHGK
jgi:nucleoside-diphosphate-sugar epimerase